MRRVDVGRENGGGNEKKKEDLRRERNFKCGHE